MLVVKIIKYYATVKKDEAECCKKNGLSVLHWFKIYCAENNALVLVNKKVFHHDSVTLKATGPEQQMVDTVFKKYVNRLAEVGFDTSNNGENGGYTIINGSVIQISYDKELDQQINRAWCVVQKNGTVEIRKRDDTDSDLPSLSGWLNMYSIAKVSKALGSLKHSRQFRYQNRCILIPFQLQTGNVLSFCDKNHHCQIRHIDHIAKGHFQFAIGLSSGNHTTIFPTTSSMIHFHQFLNVLPQTVKNFVLFLETRNYNATESKTMYNLNYVLHKFYRVMEILLESDDRGFIKKRCNIGDVGMFPTNVDHCGNGSRACFFLTATRKEHTMALTKVSTTTSQTADKRQAGKRKRYFASSNFDRKPGDYKGDEQLNANQLVNKLLEAIDHIKYETNKAVRSELLENQPSEKDMESLKTTILKEINKKLATNARQKHDLHVLGTSEGPKIHYQVEYDGKYCRCIDILNNKENNETVVIWGGRGRGTANTYTYNEYDVRIEE
eukprot:g3063.t1